MDDDSEPISDLDEHERQFYIKARYVTLQHPVTKDVLRINVEATEVIEMVKKARGYVEVDNAKDATKPPE